MKTKQTETLSGLPNLYKTLDDATEELGAFLSLARGGEAPLESLTQAAAKTVQELAAWRLSLKEVVYAPELAETPRVGAIF
ncbi:MAG: hypothetical protein O3C28_08095 [Proteobacteria bacterium]|nr:hypothetical protein [Pseudomonadota bacterium]